MMRAGSSVRPEARSTEAWTTRGDSLLAGGFHTASVQGRGEHTLVLGEEGLLDGTANSRVGTVSSDVDNHVD